MIGLLYTALTYVLGTLALAIGALTAQEPPPVFVWVGVTSKELDPHTNVVTCTHRDLVIAIGDARIETRRLPCAPGR